MNRIVSLFPGKKGGRLGGGERTSTSTLDEIFFGMESCGSRENYGRGVEPAVKEKPGKQ